MRHLVVVAGFLIPLAAAAQAADRPHCEEVQRTLQAQIDAACPCATAQTRAAHVHCVADKLRALSGCHKGADGAQVCGSVPRACAANLRREAARSTCGEPNAVACCLPRQHDCLNDPAPGDGKKEGTCSRSQKPCDTLTDCRIPACRKAATADHCTRVGGTVGSGTDCNTACAP
ncbi:MAG: hypothetical protein HY271_01085 [Deltaproteobacteria bacterium]|nr:hypothetical protein [Deltaproteobacteria bacterium]